MLGKFWLAIFVIYCFAASPLLIIALAHIVGVA